MRPWLLPLILCVLVPSPVFAGPAPSFLGPTGSLLTPTAETLGQHTYAMTLHHRADWNLLAVHYSPLDPIEVGVTVLDPTRPGLSKTQFGVNGKWLAIRESAQAPALAVGIWDAFGWVQAKGKNVSLYAVATKRIQLPWPSRPLAASLGWGSGLYKHRAFWSLALPVAPSVSPMAEFDGTNFNLGARVGLPHGFVLDVAAVHWELGLGATYAARW